MSSVGIVWFRQDLRLSDNPALIAACQECDSIVLLFIDDPVAQTMSQVGQASRVWLHHSLYSLRQSLQHQELDLLILQGDALSELSTVVDQFRKTHDVKIYWNRCYDPATLQRDKKIKAAFKEITDVHSFNGLLLFEPWETQSARCAAALSGIATTEKVSWCLT